jgi:hypothetical protein
LLKNVKVFNFKAEFFRIPGRIVSNSAASAGQEYWGREQKIAADMVV